MDYADDATRYARFYERLAIERTLARTDDGATTRPSAEHCEQCDEPIPEARRAAEPGCNLCVDCKARLERRR